MTRKDLYQFGPAARDLSSLAINANRIRIHHGDDAAADDHGDGKPSAVRWKCIEARTCGRLAVARGDRARNADRMTDHARLGERQIDCLGLRIARSEA